MAAYPIEGVEKELNEEEGAFGWKYPVVEYTNLEHSEA